MRDVTRQLPAVPHPSRRPDQQPRYLRRRRHRHAHGQSDDKARCQERQRHDKFDRGFIEFGQYVVRIGAQRHQRARSGRRLSLGKEPALRIWRLPGRGRVHRARAHHFGRRLRSPNSRAAPTAHHQCPRSDVLRRLVAAVQDRDRGTSFDVALANVMALKPQVGSYKDTPECPSTGSSPRRSPRSTRRCSASTTAGLHRQDHHTLADLVAVVQQQQNASMSWSAAEAENELDRNPPPPPHLSRRSGGGALSIPN